MVSGACAGISVVALAAGAAASPAVFAVVFAVAEGAGAAASTLADAGSFAGLDAGLRGCATASVESAVARDQHCTEEPNTRSHRRPFYSSSGPRVLLEAITTTGRRRGRPLCCMTARAAFGMSAAFRRACRRAAFRGKQAFRRGPSAKRTIIGALSLRAVVQTLERRGFVLTVGRNFREAAPHRRAQDLPAFRRLHDPSASPCWAFHAAFSAST